MRSLLYALIGIGSLCCSSAIDAQQYIPNIPAQNSCTADQRLLQQAYNAALAKVRQRRMNEVDFRKHISGCDKLDLIYYRQVAAL